jgi:hypothetical protein
MRADRNGVNKNSLPPMSVTAIEIRGEQAISGTLQSAPCDLRNCVEIGG